MKSKIRNPFGEVESESEFNSPSPLRIDKEEALKDIKTSLLLWKKRKVTKKSFFQSFFKKKDSIVKAPHWEFSEESRGLVNIHLKWSNEIIRTISNVPEKKVNTALNGLKTFYLSISSIKPDLGNNDILMCYNQTSKNYGLPEKVINLKNEIEVSSIDPFGGVKGDILVINSNNLSVDKKKALESLNLSINKFKEICNNLKKTKIPSKIKNFAFSYKTSTDYFNVHLVWAGEKIKSVERVDKKKAQLALLSLRDFIRGFNPIDPNLKDPIVKLMYNATIEKHKPKLDSKKSKELLSVDDGGSSYWSNKSHRWIKGKFDKKSKKFIYPNKNL